MSNYGFFSAIIFRNGSKHGRDHLDVRGWSFEIHSKLVQSRTVKFQLSLLTAGIWRRGARLCSFCRSQRTQCGTQNY